MSLTLRADQLGARLQRGEPLAALYTVTGDEPLLAIEAMDALRAAARQAGHVEREVIVADARTDWATVLAGTQSMSLFGERRILELKLPGGKPGKAGGDFIARMAAQCGTHAAGQADCITLVQLPKLDKTTRATPWFTALTANGVLVEVPTIDRNALPDWIALRLAAQNQRARTPALQWMAERIEGNLLAAHQEIQKLGLLYPEGELSAEQIEDAVANVARYDVFTLRDAMLAGDAPRVVRTLEGLRAEGEALPLVLWAVGEEIRLLATLADARQQGRDVGALMRSLRFFGPRERLAQQALDRVAPQVWTAAVRHAHEVDRMIKGLSVPGRLADPWHEVIRLALRVASRPARTSRPPVRQPA